MRISAQDDDDSDYFMNSQYLVTIDTGPGCVRINHDRIGSTVTHGGHERRKDIYWTWKW